MSKLAIFKCSEQPSNVFDYKIKVLRILLVLSCKNIILDNFGIYKCFLKVTYYASKKSVFNIPSIFIKK